MLRSIVVIACGLSIACFAVGCGGEDCEPRMEIYCDVDSDLAYWVDSCGEIGEVKDDCLCGCLSDRSGCEPCECLSDNDCGFNEECDPSTNTCIPTCTPITCQSEGYDCGSWSDGCGGQIVCGNCPNNFNCNGSGGCDCLNHSACDATSICIYGDCLAAYGRRYEFTIRSANISQYDQNGDSWDWPGGMPDPFVCAYRNDQAAEHCTSAVQDTFTATFNSSFQADIYAADKWTFVAFDEDVSDHDQIGGVFMEPVSVATIKDGGFVFNSTYLVELVVDITPVQ
jgi:hypothetical protein